jgi:hypothetical protein
MVHLFRRIGEERTLPLHSENGYSPDNVIRQYQIGLHNLEAVGASVFRGAVDNSGPKLFRIHPERGAVELPQEPPSCLGNTRRAPDSL